MSHVSTAFYGSPWAMYLPKLREVESVIRSRFFVQRGAGRPRRIKAPAAFDDDYEPKPKAALDRDKPYRMMGAVAVIPIFGMICPRMNMLTEFSGGTSTEKLGRQVDQAIADPDVASIVFDVDSPGGSVHGVPEIAERIFAARRAKRMVAVVNPLMASAAYFLGSAATEVVLTPSGLVGSIGVYWLHEDVSGALEKAGIKPTFIYAGQYKVEGNETEPLGDEARAALQATVDHYYTQFVDAVARHRGASSEAVRGGFGQGRVLTAKDAIGARLVDRIASFDQVLAEERSRADGGNSLALMKRRQQQAAAEAELA